ncbi:MAG: hypothetical protein V3V08_04800 [Nannocystaceae bacterium]
MLEDFEILVDEFDLQGLLSPQSPEHFLMNLVMVAAFAAVLYVAYKALSRLF